jgi:hypothetical protein
MSGGKGGSKTTEVEVPPYVSDAARRNLARADRIANIGYTPYYGADVAAMTPMQQAAMQGTNQMSSAFGLPSVSDPMAGMPQAQDFGGMQAYSSAPLFEQSLEALAQNRPEQYKAIEGMFNPTGGTSYGSGYGGGYGESSNPIVGAMDLVSNAVGSQNGTDTGGGASDSGGGFNPINFAASSIPMFGDVVGGALGAVGKVGGGLLDAVGSFPSGEATRKRLEKERRDRILAPIMQEIEANDPTPQGMTRMEYNLMKNPNKYATKSLTDDELEQQYYNTGLL